MFEVGAFSAGSNSVQTSGGRTKATSQNILLCCQRQGGHGTHRLRRFTASAWRQDIRSRRCDYSGRSGFGGLRGRHFACGFSWSFSGCRVHRPRLSTFSIAVGIDALNADSALCRADNTQTCRICRSLAAALPLPSRRRHEADAPQADYVAGFPLSSSSRKPPGRAPSGTICSKVPPPQGRARPSYQRPVWVVRRAAARNSRFDPSTTRKARRANRSGRGCDETRRALRPSRAGTSG